MNVLAIETNGEVKSIALACDGVLAAEVSFSGDLLSGFWPVLKDFLHKNCVTLKEIDLFTVNRGPGSWTGLRFGLSVVKGWAAAAGKKVFAMTDAEITAAKQPGRSAAAVLALAASGGKDPEELEPVYGHLPKFRKMND